MSGEVVLENQPYASTSGIDLFREGVHSVRHEMTHRVIAEPVAKALSLYLTLGIALYTGAVVWLWP